MALEAAGHPERYQGWRQWTVQQVVVDGPSPLVALWTAKRAPGPHRCSAGYDQVPSGPGIAPGQPGASLDVTGPEARGSAPGGVGKHVAPPKRPYGTITRGTGEWRAKLTATEPTTRCMAWDELPTTITTSSFG